MARLKTLMTEILSHDKTDHSAFRSDLQDEIISRYELLDVFKEVLEQDKEEKVNHLAVCTVLCAKCSNKWFVDSMQTLLRTKDFSVVKEILEMGFVPPIANKEHYIFDKNDFEGVANIAVTVMSVFNIMLEKFSEELDTNDILRAFISQILPELLHLILEHADEKLWSSELSMVMAKNILRLIKQLYKCELDADLLTCNRCLTKDDAFKTTENSILNQMLKLLIPRLSKCQWKKHPGTKSVFQWCLFNTSFPNLYEHLEKVLPPSLIFVDDYILDNKIVGIQCLHHIMDNLSSEQLRWYGRADVIYQAIKHQMYTSEVALNEVSYPAMLTILNIVEKFPGPTDDIVERKSAKHEEIFLIFLQNVECENKIALRQILINNLIDFVEVMGLLTVKYLEKIIQIIDDYLQVYEGPEEISSLNVLNLLQKVMKNAWPRIPHYMENILRMLMKFLCNLSIQESERPEKSTLLLADKVTTCLKLLKLIGGDKCVLLIKSVDSPELPPLCVKVLKDVLYSVDCTG